MSKEMDKGIKDILELEKEAENIKKKAEKKAIGITEDENAQLVKLRTEYEEKLNKKKETALKSYETELKKRREEILSREGENRDKLVKKAEKNMDKAVDHIIGTMRSK
jgi:hypothetical protein